MNKFVGLILVLIVLNLSLQAAMAGPVSGPGNGWQEWREDDIDTVTRFYKDNDVHFTSELINGRHYRIHDFELIYINSLGVLHKYWYRDEGKNCPEFLGSIDSLEILKKTGKITIENIHKSQDYDEALKRLRRDSSCTAKKR